MVTMAFVSSRFNAWCACSPHVTGDTRQYGAVLVFFLYLCLCVSRLLALPLFPPSGLSFFYYQYKGSVVMRERNGSLTCRKRGTPLAATPQYVPQPWSLHRCCPCQFYLRVLEYIRIGVQVLESSMVDESCTHSALLRWKHPSPCTSNDNIGTFHPNHPKINKEKETERWIWEWENNEEEECNHPPKKKQSISGNKCAVRKGGEDQRGGRFTKREKLFMVNLRRVCSIHNAAHHYNSNKQGNSFQHRNSVVGQLYDDVFQFSISLSPVL